MSPNNEKINTINIIDNSNNTNLFDFDSYVIPLYQRAYTWKEKHISQLIEDIIDVEEDKNYYIGSLIVSSKGTDCYEVIDGQQRLTTLYLLLNFLRLKVKNNLSFACRDKSNYSLKHIKALINDESSLDKDRIDVNIQQKLRIFSDKFSKLSQVYFDKEPDPKQKFIETFKKKLAKVIIFRIEVPQYTDLNRYFEIMNTRGEQLEKTDILKAKLMSYLKEEKEDNNHNQFSNAQQKMFSKVWDACSDMTGYVQMHFISKNNILRYALFGPNWNTISKSISNESEFDDLFKIIKKLENELVNKPKNTDSNKKDNTLDILFNNQSSYSIKDIIKENFNIKDNEEVFDRDRRVRFESIIEFPYFLLHTLKVFVNHYKIKDENNTEKIIDDLLDDKKLLETFKKVIENGVIENNVIGKQKIRENKKDFSLKFIDCLLKTRFLFDKYIIKREYANEDLDGQWSLESLNVSDGKPYYKNTIFVKSNNDLINKRNIMIQSALRVSYTSPKVMHWITELLKWLYENSFKENMEKHNEILFNPCWKAQIIAAKAVKENFLDKQNFNMGVNTPHIVFNFLDYLLWLEKEKEKDYCNFIFEFRNSVEHWYPQNPSDGREKWDDVDRFGNLCIVQRNINSKFSNMPPESKKITFKNMISKGSIKLRIMSGLTSENKSDGDWINKCKEHEEIMIKKLKDKCDQILYIERVNNACQS